VWGNWTASSGAHGRASLGGRRDPLSDGADKRDAWTPRAVSSGRRSRDSSHAAPRRGIAFLECGHRLPTETPP